MKTILMLVSLLVLLGACIRETDDSAIGGEVCTGDGQVCLSFVDENYSQTKAFGGSGATAIEKKVYSAKVFIFQAGTKIFEKLLSSTEINGISGTPITFTVPKMMGNTTYVYYVIINHGDVTASSVADLQAISETDISSYNGDWTTVNESASAPNRTGGFVMTGTTSAPTNADLSGTQNISVNMKRITAKLDITTNIDANYFGTGKPYQGTITIDSVKVVKTQAATPLVITTPTQVIGTLTLGKQASFAAGGGIYQNRFYVFENGPISAGNRSALNIYATYVNGGVSSVVLYSLELNPNGSAGAIVRNGAYAINATIQGLTGGSVSLTITLSDWETLVSQNANLGS